jgi:hypothetical protein
MWRTQRYIYGASRNSVSRKPHSSPPSPSSSAAEITILLPVFYKFMAISALVPPTEFISVLALLYFEKEYIKIDENWTTHHAFCWTHTYD